MMSMNSETRIDGITWRMVENIHRFKLIGGFMMIYVCVFALYNGLYFDAIPAGFCGGLCLGGWPALRRLFRRPVWQIKQWYYILIDARQYTHYHGPDGRVRVVEMEPRTWGWVQDRSSDLGEDQER